MFPSEPSDAKSRNGRQDYLNGKFGHEKKTIYSQIAAAGIESGINFNFDLTQRTPDSRVSHRYILLLMSLVVI